MKMKCIKARIITNHIEYSKIVRPTLPNNSAVFLVRLFVVDFVCNVHGISKPSCKTHIFNFTSSERLFSSYIIHFYVFREYFNVTALFCLYYLLIWEGKLKKKMLKMFLKNST